MGDNEGWAQPSGLLPNGLLPNEAASVTRVLDTERWSKAEERTAELIACIQPNQPSEERRNAVADYVQRLIMKCFSCQVFTFGSVPLKTYLPDGDIDLTAFSKNQNSKDTWANEVRDMLENEEKRENAEFRVKEVQYIQAEVKIIKCLVENIVVDISFNQLGGLCTLCFLEEVDHLINQNHLFKRSIILIKAWCYYESRILGAHHGLISTYALETLVLYIFHVFNNSLSGPLEVLYRFLEFFSNFDWDNFCVSLWGPVPISSLPDMTAEPPRRDSGELLLSKLFLDACSSVYAVFPSSQESQGQTFVSKHFNVIDPLRTNNNLGRSVSKGNFFRIRSAFAFGAKKLARLLECPKECVIAEVNQFFMNTWDRHGSGNRPDAPCSNLCQLRPLNFEPVDGSDNFKKHLTNKRENDGHESDAVRPSRTGNVSLTSRGSSQKNCTNQTSLRDPDQISRNSNSSEVRNSDKVLKNLKPSFLTSEHEAQGRFHFARTRSSPELTDTSGEALFRGRRNKIPDTGKSQFVSARSEHTNRRRNTGSEISGSHSVRSSGDDPSSLRHSSSQQTLDATADSNSVSNSYHEDIGTGAVGEDLASASESMEMQQEMHQEEQDLVNMMASTRFHNIGGKVQLPMNLASAHLPFPVPSSVLASMGYAPRNFAGMVPANIPLIDPAWGSGVQFPQGMVSSPLSHYLPGVGFGSTQEDMIDFGNENSGLTEISQEDGDNGFWQEHDAGSTSGFDSDGGSFHIAQSDSQQQSNMGGFNFVPSRAANSSGSFIRGQHKFVQENRGKIRDDYGDNFQYQNIRGSDAYSSDGNANLRFLPVTQASTSRTKTGSESSWDGSSARVIKSARDKRGRKASTSSVPATNVYGKAKTGWQYEAASAEHGSSLADEFDNRDWIPLSTVGPEMAERNQGSKSVGPPNIRSHQLPSYESAQLPGSDPVIPLAPMLLGSSSRQRTMDTSGAVPFAFYPTGPPVPFLTMLPLYNFPADSGNSDGSASPFDREDGLDTGRGNHSDQNFDSAENLDLSEILSSTSSIKSSVVEPHQELKPDILNSDFASHWQNLQYGRFCQNPRYNGPLIYPSPVVVPPVYLQGHFPWDGPGRPLSANVNLVTQLMGYGPRFVPVAPVQPSSNRPGSVYQRYGEEVPRYHRAGTGTYLPNPKPVPFRDRQSSNTRNHRGSYNYDRNNHGDREGNWNINSKARGMGRNHGYIQAEKPSSRPDRPAPPDGQPDRLWDSYRHEPFGLSQAQNGPYSSSNSMHSSANMAYGMYPLPAVNSNGSASAGPGVPSVVMLYPYEQHVGYGPPGDQLEFGSLGPVQFAGVNEVPQLTDSSSVMGVYEQKHITYQGGSPARSSPDQPSSPHIQRRI